MLSQINKILAAALLCVIVSTIAPVFAVLSCSITTAAGCSGTVVLRMSSATNAHAELPNQSTANYANNVICCTGLSGVLCTGYTANVLKLSSTTNAHVEIATNSNYPETVCMSAGSEIPAIEYQDNNCIGYDTTLVSISSTTNATVGSSTEFIKKVCGSLIPPSFTFNISTTTIFFGGLSQYTTRYASSTNEDGSSSQVEAHNFSVKTNTLNGYTVNVQGETLTSENNTVSAIGNINTSPLIGTEQFGLRVTALGGVGAVSSPYVESGFAYASSATTSSQVASASTGDNATTTYSVRYVANIAGFTETGLYIANIVYVATANF